MSPKVDEGTGDHTGSPIQLPQGAEILQKLDQLTTLVLALQASLNAVTNTVNTIQAQTQ